MASSTYRLIKPDLKRYEKRRLYMRQSNFIIANEPYQSSKCYRIDLNFLADQNKSLIDIFLTYFESIHELKANGLAKPPTNTLKYNQIFSLMVKNYFICDLFLPKVVKASQEDRMANFQIIGFMNLQYLDQLALNAQIRDLCELTKAEMQGKFKGRLEEALRERKEGEEQKNSLRLDIINSILRQQKEKTIQYIIAIQDPTIKQLYVTREMKDVQRLYLRKIIDSLLAFRFTKKLYRSLKFANFIQKKYKGYYNLNYLKQHGYNIRERRQNKFIMKRYTNNDNQYLTNLYSLVKIRDKSQKYDCEMFQTTKQLLKELISHNMMTKSAYPMLSPHSIIFNQISLKIQLSYQNPLLQALGLLSKPVNTENLICHMATPTPYDTYANQAELNNPQLQTNHLIGINHILKEHYKISGLNSNSDLALQKSQAEQASQSWRFMMTAHYLMHGKEYYRTAGAPTFKKLHDFKAFVRKEEQKLKSSEHKGYYTTILGQNFMRFVSHKLHEKQYDPSLYFFENLFSASQDSDSVIQQFGQIKINRYLKLFVQNIRQLLILTSHQLFSHVYNTIHHLLRFYLGIFLQISQIMVICGHFSKNQDIGVKLFEELAAKMGKETLKKSSYVEISYEKFKQYKRRQNVRSETQYTYLKLRYKEQYGEIDDHYQFHRSLKTKISQISGHKTNERFNIDPNSKKEALVSQLSTSLSIKLSKIRPTISALIYHQFILQKQASIASQRLNYLTTKLELLMLLVLGLSHQNFITVQSIIMPALRTTEAMQDNSLTDSKSDERYIEQRELCDNCIQIMKEQTVEVGLDFQKNEGQRAGKQHGKVDEKGHSKDFPQNK